MCLRVREWARTRARPLSCFVCSSSGGGVGGVFVAILCIRLRQQRNPARALALWPAVMARRYVYWVQTHQIKFRVDVTAPLSSACEFISPCARTLSRATKRIRSNASHQNVWHCVHGQKRARIYYINCCAIIGGRERERGGVEKRALGP